MGMETLPYFNDLGDSNISLIMFGKKTHVLLANGKLFHHVRSIYGYGSIPIDTFLVGWTSIYQLFWGSPGVPGFWPIPIWSKKTPPPRCRWDPHQWHTATAPGNSRTALGLLSLSCVDACTAWKLCRVCGKHFPFIIGNFTNLTMQTDIILRFYEWGCQPFAPIYDRTSIHKICIQQISSQLGLPEATSPIFPMNPWIYHQLSCYNGRTTGYSHFFVKSPNFLCELRILPCWIPRFALWTPHFCRQTPACLMVKSS